MQIISSEQAKELLTDEWARTKLYNVDYTHLNKDRLALYHVDDISPKQLEIAIEEKQNFLFDGTL